jgi:hypothetical protein
MNNDAIALALSKLVYDRPGYRVVGADRNACPYHYGVFASEADAVALLEALKADGDPTPRHVKYLKGAR